MIVSGSIQLDYQPQKRAIEVHDESAQDVLASELEAEDPVVPQQRPSEALGRRRIVPQPPSELKLGGVWVVAAIEPMAKHAHIMVKDRPSTAPKKPSYASESRRRFSFPLSR